VSSVAAADLVEEIRAELAPVRERLLSHPYVASVEGGRVELAGLRPFAGEQHLIIASDLRAWGESCGRLSAALRGRCGLTAEQVRFFDLFAEPSPEFRPAGAGRGRGGPPPWGAGAGGAVGPAPPPELRAALLGHAAG
jgi:hypothetical protein